MNSNQIFNLSMLLALVTGGILGSTSLPFVHESAHVVSTLFLNMLKLISLPMIFLALVSTLTRMKNLKEAGFLIKKILKYTLITTLIAATIGMLVFLVIQPIKIIENTAPSFTHTTETYLSFLTQIIPDSLIQPFMHNNVLGMAFLAVILSAAILKLPEEKGRILREFFGALFDALLKVTSALIFIMPLGILAFTIQFIQSIRAEAAQLQQLLFYALCVVSANLIQGCIVLPLMLKLKGHSPIKVAKGMMPALTMAFFSKSSNATLPLSIDCAKDRLGISEKTATFSFPLCSVINMNGCAAFILITLFFVCSSQGITFTVWQMIPWIFLSTIAAVGNAGVPMGCFFLTTAFLIGMGVPLEIMGMILPLYAIFDMVETALNVWSDSCITTVVEQEVSQTAPKPALVESN